MTKPQPERLEFLRFCFLKNAIESENKRYRIDHGLCKNIDQLESQQKVRYDSEANIGRKSLPRPIANPRPRFIVKRNHLKPAKITPLWKPKYITRLMPT